METSYLKARPFGHHYQEWMPNIPSDRGQDSSLCIWGSQGPQNVRGSIVPRWPPPLFYYVAASGPRELMPRCIYTGVELGIYAFI